MRPDVQRDFDWQRRFIPQLKRIMGEHLIGEAPFEEDAERNTDLIVLRLDAVRVACRVRRPTPGYFDRYGHQFTIRYSRPSGAFTELAKIVSGFGDYLIYGWSDTSELHLYSWVLGDLSAFRLWFARTSARTGAVPGELKPNDDGTFFRAFDIAVVPGFVVARHLPEPMEVAA